MTEYPAKFEEAVKPRFIIDPEKYGKEEYDPETMNWSSQDLRLPNGKLLGVFKVANTALFRIGYAEDKHASQVPRQYSGMYTSPNAAQQAIVIWLRSAWTDAESRTRTLSKREKDADIKEKREKAEVASDAVESK